MPQINESNRLNDNPTQQTSFEKTRSQAEPLTGSDALSPPPDNEATAAAGDSNATSKESEPSLAALQLAAGTLQIFEPSLIKAKAQLNELICKQYKIFNDLSAENLKLNSNEIVNLHEMMNSAKIYREKLIAIKKQTQSIFQRTKVLKKRSSNIEMCKQKELQRKLQKQQHEESLIGKQQQQQQQQTEEKEQQT